MTKITVKHADGSTVKIPPTLPCPFCGSILSHAGPASANSYEVRCLDCGARTRRFLLSDRVLRPMAVEEQMLIERAAAAWNRRSDRRSALPPK